MTKDKKKKILLLSDDLRMSSGMMKLYQKSLLWVLWINFIGFN